LTKQELVDLLRHTVRPALDDVGNWVHATIRELEHTARATDSRVWIGMGALLLVLTTLEVLANRRKITWFWKTRHARRRAPEDTLRPEDWN
jgi:hypothetical protein